MFIISYLQTKLQVFFCSKFKEQYFITQYFPFNTHPSPINKEIMIQELSIQNKKEWYIRRSMETFMYCTRRPGLKLNCTRTLFPILLKRKGSWDCDTNPSPHSLAMAQKICLFHYIYNKFFSFKFISQNYMTSKINKNCKKEPYNIIIMRAHCKNTYNFKNSSIRKKYQFFISIQFFHFYQVFYVFNILVSCLQKKYNFYSNHLRVLAAHSKCLTELLSQFLPYAFALNKPLYIKVTEICKLGGEGRQ